MKRQFLQGAGRTSLSVGRLRGNPETNLSARSDALSHERCDHLLSRGGRMTPNLLAHGLSGVGQATQMSSRIPAAPDVLDQGTIANLPSTRISELQCDD